MGIEGLGLYFNNNSILGSNNNILQRNILNTSLGVNTQYQPNFFTMLNQSLNKDFISELEECQKETDNCKSSQLIKELYESYKQDPLLYNKFGINGLLYKRELVENAQTNNKQIQNNRMTGAVISPSYMQSIPEEGQIEKQIEEQIKAEMM